MAKRAAQNVGKLVKKGSSSSLKAGRPLASASTPKMFSPSSSNDSQRTPSPTKLGAQQKPKTGGDKTGSQIKPQVPQATQTQRPDMEQTKHLWTTSKGIEVRMSTRQSQGSQSSLVVREKNCMDFRQRITDEVHKHMNMIKKDNDPRVALVQAVAMDGGHNSDPERSDQTLHFNIFMIQSDGSMYCAHVTRYEEDQEESDKTAPWACHRSSSPYRGKGKGRK
ncbi:hypothetical protein IWX49DRAFT_38574 [Phyllosticta citricarpa]|uniref:Uncharacterized protein n=1 Tax=Phyllosticta citricarpa TaxID=55181 RepID=A0ABR1MG26_9PEZI